MKRLARTLAVLAALSACKQENQRPSTAVDQDTGTRPDTFVVTTDTGSPMDTGLADTTIPETFIADTAMPDVEMFDALAPPICPKGSSLLPGMMAKTTPVAYPSPAATDRLSAITWDELTMAWSSEEGGKTVLHYADRTTTDEAFATTRTLPDSLGPFNADDKVALTADGLRMLLPAADHKSIREIRRTSRAVPFDASPVATTAYDRIFGSSGVEGGMPALVTDLVLSRDGKRLYYTDLLRTSGSSIRVSFLLSDGTWDAPSAIYAMDMQMSGTSRRRPTGLSADNRTLYYYDEVSATPRAAFRPGTSLDFTEFFAVLPPGTRPMPSSACDRIYLTASLASDAGPSDRIVRTP